MKRNLVKKLRFVAVFALFSCCFAKSDNKSIFKYQDNIQYVLKDDSGDESSLDDFVDTYLHLDDYNDNQGYCNDKEHNYYQIAKEALENLSPEDRAKLAYDKNYSDAYSRLISWALANGESLYIDPKSGFIIYDYEEDPTDNSPILVACISVVAIASLGIVGYLIFSNRKKRIV